MGQTGALEKKAEIYIMRSLENIELNIFISKQTNQTIKRKRKVLHTMHNYFSRFSMSTMFMMVDEAFHARCSFSYIKQCHRKKACKVNRNNFRNCGAKYLFVCIQ